MSRADSYLLLLYWSRPRCVFNCQHVLGFLQLKFIIPSEMSRFSTLFSVLAAIAYLLASAKNHFAFRAAVTCKLDNLQQGS